MNPIEQIRAEIGRRFPSCTLNVDETESLSGPWFLDVCLEGKMAVVVELRPGHGIGIIPIDADGGWAGPGETVPTAENAIARIDSLIRGINHR